MTKKNSFSISNDKSKLDIQLIHNFLSNDSYWAKGRSKEVVQRSIDNSICLGVYLNGKQQVGFARIVTDYSVFAWILDVFILEDYRKKGLGKMLMDTIMSCDELQDLQRWGLGTNDTHGLYERYGFRAIKSPEMFMELVKKPS